MLNVIGYFNKQSEKDSDLFRLCRGHDTVVITENDIMSYDKSNNYLIGIKVPFRMSWIVPESYIIRSIKKCIKPILVKLDSRFESVRFDMMKGCDGDYYLRFRAKDLNAIFRKRCTIYEDIPIIKKMVVDGLYCRIWLVSKGVLNFEILDCIIDKNFQAFEDVAVIEEY